MPTLHILNASTLSLFPARHRLLLQWWPVTVAEGSASLDRQWPPAAKSAPR